MIIDCISDCHGEYPILEGGDLLIVAGDLTARDHKDEYTEFELWLIKQNYRKKILIGGNHDNKLYKKEWFLAVDNYTEYLCDSGTEFGGLKIWGSPWTKTFPGINRLCKAFTVDTEDELAEKWKLIPADTDILITHMPPHGIFDKLERYRWAKIEIEHVGSKSLKDTVDRIKPKAHVFGHIHEWGGQMMADGSTTYVNACVMNQVYEHVNKPVRLVL